MELRSPPARAAPTASAAWPAASRPPHPRRPGAHQGSHQTSLPHTRMRVFLCDTAACSSDGRPKSERGVAGGVKLSRARLPSAPGHCIIMSCYMRKGPRA